MVVLPGPKAIHSAESGFQARTYKLRSQSCSRRADSCATNAGRAGTGPTAYEIVGTHCDPCGQFRAGLADRHMSYMEAPADIHWHGYSVAERDWRWRRVRDEAAKADFDCILVPLCVDGRNLHLSLEQARGTRSDCRFLTALDNAAVILPTDGDAPIVMSNDERGNDWIPEFRPVENSWGESMARALLDLGMDRARIGVSGIRRGFYTHGRAFHGVVNHSSYAEVLRRL